MTTIVFGLFHVIPHAIALATILGLWLGVIAYRIGSIWPGGLCHGCINSAWNFWKVGKRLWGFPETVSPTVAAIGIVIMVVLFAVATWVLVRCISKPTDVSG